MMIKFNPAGLFVLIAFILLNGVVFRTSADTSIRFNDWQTVGPSGGDVRSMRIDQKNQQRLYFGTLDGQIYASGNAGKTWELLVNFNRPQMAIDDLIIDSRDSNILYVGGHRHKSDGGFFKSTDGGKTWRESKDLKKEAIHALVQSSKNPDLLIAGTYGSIFVSKDAGENWEKIKSDTAPPATLIMDSVEIDPRDTNTIYVGTTYRAYKTIDGGKNWKLIKEGMIDDSDVFAIDIDPRNADHIIASACSGIYESFNAGESWKKIQGIPSQSRRTRAIVRNPTNKDSIYAGTTEGFWLSNDGGKNWTLTTSRQLEINAIVVHAAEPNKIYIGTNNYGIMISEDGGKTFSMSNGGFSARQTNEIVQDIERPNRLYATTINTARGGGFFFISDDSGKTWSPSMKNMPSELITYSILQDKINTNRILLGTGAGLYQSPDRGTTWTKVLPPKPVVTPKKAPVRKKGTTAKRTVVAAVKPTPVPATTTTTAIKPLSGCPTAKVNALSITVNQLSYTNDGKNGLLAATMCGIYRTYDLAKGWERLPFPVGNDLITRTMLAASQQPNTIWAGTASSGLLVSRDNGISFQAVEDITKTAPISSIAIDPQRPENIYVGTNQTFYLSRDGGLKWKRRGGNLPIGDYVTILINPSNTDEIFVGSALETSAGVFRSTDAGEKWTRIDPKEQNLASRRVWSLAFDPQDKTRLLIGSHSAGIYSVGVTPVSTVQVQTRPRMATQ